MQTAQNAPALSRPVHFSLNNEKSLRCESTPQVRRFGWTRLCLLLLAIFLVGCAVAAFSVDLSVAQWVRESHKLRVLRYPRDLASICEIFGRAECVLLVVVLMWRLDPMRRWAVPGVAATAICSGLAADGVKMLIARARPHSFNFLGSVWSSFGPWLPLGSLGSASQSFPSAHTATAVGLAIALMCIYPAARGLFCFLPFLVAYQRIDSGAHFLSDVLCGAAVACLVASLALHAHWLDRDFAERFWGRVGETLRMMPGWKSQISNPKSQTNSKSQ
jgi:membrane-associated phospholipid phosphatase